ncbi:MAG: hydroxyacylglutathione hydrolase [Bdellovibrionales bacterium]
MNVNLIPIYEDNYVFHFVTDDGISVVVDPGDADPVIQYLDANNLTLQVILHTHHHWDHINGDQKLQEKYNCEIWGPEYEIMRIPNMNVLLEDQQTYTLGTQSFKVIHTPGHTRGHICIYFENDKTLFAGDTLFSLGCGRLFEGTPEEMWASLKVLRALPDDTKIYCAHEYTLSNAKFLQSIEPNSPQINKLLEHAKNTPTIPTSIAFEKAYNPFLRADDKDFQETLRMEHASSEEVFAHIRKLKDDF